MRPEVGPVLLVRGADLMDGTPIYDIKPTFPYADCHPDAAAGFTAQTQFHHLDVACPETLWARSPQTSGTVCGVCSKTTPVPPTSTTRNGYTEWNFQD